MHGRGIIRRRLLFEWVHLLQKRFGFGVVVVVVRRRRADAQAFDGVLVLLPSSFRAAAAVSSLLPTSFSLSSHARPHHLSRAENWMMMMMISPHHHHHLLLLLLLLLFGTTIFWISHKRARAFFLSLFLSVEQQRKKSRALSPAKVTPL